MEFNIPKTHELFRQMIREFAEKEVKPLAAEVDEEERFPVETVKKMAEIGLMGIPIPKQYGGAGGDNVMYAMAVEELSRVCGTTGVIVSAHTSLGTWPILHFGTEEQKQKYIPKLASGEWLGAFGLTEPNAGTDAAGQQTTAVLDEATNEWVINGSKIFITNAGYADVYVIFGMTDRSKGLKGISAFCTNVRIKRSMVATLPAKAERSANLQTPSSIITRGSKATLLSLAAHDKASVITQARSTPLIL